MDGQGSYNRLVQMQSRGPSSECSVSDDSVCVRNRNEARCCGLHPEMGEVTPPSSHQHRGHEHSTQYRQNVHVYDFRDVTNLYLSFRGCPSVWLSSSMCKTWTFSLYLLACLSVCSYIWLTTHTYVSIRLKSYSNGNSNNFIYIVLLSLWEHV